MTRLRLLLSRPAATAGRELAGQALDAVDEVRREVGRLADDLEIGQPAEQLAKHHGYLAARELGPENIHVAHLVIDAGVDTAFVRDRIQAAGHDPSRLPPDSLMNPASIGEAYWMLHQQTRDAWTFELDLRPHRETW